MVNPDDDYIIFSYFGRDDSLGGGELLVGFSLPNKYN